MLHEAPCLRARLAEAVKDTLLQVHALGHARSNGICFSPSRVSRYPGAPGLQRGHMRVVVTGLGIAESQASKRSGVRSIRAACVAVCTTDANSPTERFGSAHSGSRPLTRSLHFFGTDAAAIAIVVAALRRSPRLLLTALGLAYELAWVGHFLVEHNRPATFSTRSGR